MLIQLTVKNFAIAKALSVSFQPGMTVITGETGAGKSIILDALNLTLGDRADAGVVRHGESRADITAIYDLTNLPQAREWLAENDLDSEDECILRRVVYREGRSKAYVNGQPVPLAQLRQIGEMLLELHSQHEHQSLLKKENHLALVDHFGGCSHLADEVRRLWSDWSRCHSKLQALKAGAEESTARQDYLRFQIDELEALDLQPDEVEQLEREMERLSNAEDLIRTGQQIVALCADQEPSILDQLRTAVSLAGRMGGDKEISEAMTLLDEAAIQIAEATSGLRHYVDQLEIDPQRLASIESRLSSIYQLARKHHTTPEALPGVLTKMQKELDELEGGEENIDYLLGQESRLLNAYLEQAAELSKRRADAARALSEAVCEQLNHLNMPSVRFVAELTPREKHAANGLETIEFLVSMNPGQPAKPLIRVASGGELSRISLAIQVILARNATIPTLVFDEVDVGIGGGTAEVVGQLLRTLGEQGQVLCVTHQAQVASCGHHHLHVDKQVIDGQTESLVRQLTPEQRTEEIARMLGGIRMTDATREHAREMLTLASDPGH